MIITPESTRTGVAKDHKEMLTHFLEDVRSPTGNDYGKRHVIYINSSSLDILQTCKRKAYYALNKKLVSDEESQATLFGKAVHKALEVWHSEPKNGRTSHDEQNCRGSLDAGGGGDHACTECRALRNFDRVAGALGNLEATDKRSIANGHKILKAYFKTYQDDPFEVVCDEQGPIIERRVEIELIRKDSLRVVLFGTLDAILRNTETGTEVTTDHKTTSALGTDFYQRVKPNHQYTAYVMLAQRGLKRKTDLFMVNGIQVVKSKQEFARQTTQRTEEDFAEFTALVYDICVDYITRLGMDKTYGESEMHWPLGPVNACCMWGGCSYRRICEAPVTIRKNVVEAMYTGQISA